LGNPLLEIENVSVFYGDAQAIWDASLTVESNKITALIGSNGAGKSTLLKTISGVIRPKGGQIKYSKNNLVGLKPEKVAALGISHIPEGRRLFDELTVMENLELGAYLPDARPRKQESLDHVFDLFPVLKDRLNQVAGTLSGGEQQMLAIGRALMTRPSLLLLDEPSLGLAPRIVKLLFDIIKKLNDGGATILLVEQNVRKTLEIADYAYVLRTGVMQMEGNPQDLIQRSDFRDAFLGRIG
jgi:branched-chain amino acid transport system ATP-binding protein